MSTSSKCRPRCSFGELDEEDQVISPRKHGKSTEKDVEIDGNDTVSYFSFLWEMLNH